MVNEYEVELRVTNKNTREDKLVVRTEYAYSVFDAVSQASINQIAELDNGSADIKIVKVRPPLRLVELAATEVARSLSDITRRLFVDATGQTRASKPKG